MKRKVIKQGNNTLTITLPRKWTDDFGIKAGDEIDIEKTRRDLIIHTGKSVSAEKTEVALTTPKEFLNRFLENPYRLGYNEVYVTFDETEVMKKIIVCLHNLMGYEIVKQGSKYCVIKQLMDGEEKEFVATLKRFFHLVGVMGEEAYNAIKEKNREKIEEVIITEVLTNKLACFCERILNKKGFVDQRQINTLYYLCCGLEQIADQYKDLCIYLLSRKSDKDFVVSDEILALFKEVSNCFKEYKTLFYKFDRISQYKLKEHKLSILKEIKKISIKTSQDIIVIQYMTTIIDILKHMSIRTYKGILSNEDSYEGTIMD